MSVYVHSAADSSTGLVREGNEDSAYAGRRLYAVADGLGGHVAGEVASAVVIESLRACDREVPAPELAGTLARAVSEASEAMARTIAEDPAVAGMGTTLTAMLWSGSYFALAHIGDSRGYLLRGGKLRQITEDHTMSKLVSDPAGRGPVMVRHLDGRPERSPDLALREAIAGDRYLLCSDGLSEPVSARVIRDVLASAPDASEAVRRLTALAIDAGAPDNITVIVLEVTEAGSDLAAVRPVMLGAAAAEAAMR